MRHSLLVVIGALTLLAAPASDADEGERLAAQRSIGETDIMARRHGAMQLAEHGRMEDVKLLLAALRDRDALVRHIAENAIWSIWSRSGDEQTDALLDRGVRQMQRGDYGGAIATFTRVVDAKPEFAEGWNKRATAYFLAGEYQKSLKDCDEVVKRNPQHFGVLAGYGQIYLRLEYLDRSLDYFRRALELNPNMEGAREAIEAIEDMIDERRRKAI